ncbi:MAG: FAD-binding protein [Planctomycetota bacterium]|nr:FAD-binding protein [Planctomycetota bacterium]
MLFGKFKGSVREGVPLAPYTWLQLGGEAKYLAEPADTEQLVDIVRLASQEGISIRVLGGGSNVLVSDKGFDGLVLHLSAPCFEKITIRDLSVHCGGGARLAHLITACVGSGLGGLEHLVGIPGTVGGALRSNSSTDEGDIGSLMTQATLLTRKGERIVVSAQDVNFSHRRSSLDELVILDASFELHQGDIRQLTKREQTFWIVKRSKQPNYPARSALAFVDLDGVSAVELLHRSGVNGLIEGNTQLNSTYPNYITANTGASADQVIQLLERAKKIVFEKTGFSLQPHLVVW